MGWNKIKTSARITEIIFQEYKQKKNSGVSGGVAGEEPALMFRLLFISSARMLPLAARKRATRIWLPGFLPNACVSGQCKERRGMEAVGWKERGTEICSCLLLLEESFCFVPFYIRGDPRNNRDKHKESKPKTSFALHLRFSLICIFLLLVFIL